MRAITVGSLGCLGGLPVGRVIWNACCVLIASSVCSVTGVSASIIDFESGFTDLSPVNTVNIAGNAVTFGVGPSTGPIGDAFIAAVGEPRSAFTVTNGPSDTPTSGSPGGFFLTDTSDGTDSLSAKDDYFISFANPVSSLSLDLYDYRADGGNPIGAMATLSVYSDLARTMLIDSDIFVVDGNEDDGNVETLQVQALGILAAHLEFSQGGDTGTGIDNISFHSVPEPGMSTAACMILSVFAVRWRRRKMGRRAL